MPLQKLTPDSDSGKKKKKEEEVEGNEAKQKGEQTPGGSSSSTGEQPPSKVMCSKCSRVYSSWDRFKFHVVKQHSAEDDTAKPKQEAEKTKCEICDGEFVKLNDHMEIHLIDQDRYCCLHLLEDGTECLHTEKTRGGMRKHILAEHQSGMRKPGYREKPRRLCRFETREQYRDRKAAEEAEKQKVDELAQKLGRSVQTMKEVEQVERERDEKEKRQKKKGPGDDEDRSEANQ